MLINAGIKVVFQGEYPDPLAREMLLEADIELVQWNSEEQGT